MNCVHDLSKIFEASIRIGVLCLENVVMLLQFLLSVLNFKPFVIFDLKKVTV